MDDHFNNGLNSDNDSLNPDKDGLRMKSRVLLRIQTLQKKIRILSQNRNLQKARIRKRKTHLLPPRATLQWQIIILLQHRIIQQIPRRAVRPIAGSIPV